MTKYKICKNKITGKYFCAILTTSDYRNHNIREEHFYDVDELRNARQFSSDIDKSFYNKYNIINYNTELRKQKLLKIQPNTMKTDYNKFKKIDESKR